MYIQYVLHIKLFFYLLIKLEERILLNKKKLLLRNLPKMSSDTSKASVAASSASTAPSGPPPISLDCGRANTGVWLVKVPNYLAKKWTEAPENSEVGMIQRITQTKFENFYACMLVISIKFRNIFDRGVGNIKPKQEVVFHLNEALGQTATIKIGNTTLEQKIPLAHKFLMTPLGSQDIYILRQSEENSKGG